MPQQNAGWLDIIVPAHLGCLRKWLLKQVLLLYRGQLQHSDYKYYSCVYLYFAVLWKVGSYCKFSKNSHCRQQSQCKRCAG